MEREVLIENLKDKEYRRHFVAAQVRRTVSEQIRSLREFEYRNWTQAELGRRAGMKPNAISRLENPNYGDFSINTLLRLGDAFDVGLIVRYASLSELVDWNQTVTTKSYIPPSFSDDVRLFNYVNASYQQDQQSFYRRLWVGFGIRDSAESWLTVGTTGAQKITAVMLGKSAEEDLWQKENAIQLFMGKSSQSPSPNYSML